MKNILAQFQQCISLKQQADKLGPLKTGKKLELADKAVNISFQVVGGLIDNAQKQAAQIEQLQKQLAQLQARA